MERRNFLKMLPVLVLFRRHLEPQPKVIRMRDTPMGYTPINHWDGGWPDIDYHWKYQPPLGRTLGDPNGWSWGEYP